MSDSSEVIVFDVAVLNELPTKTRVEVIDAAIHRLQFERRYALLTDEQLAHMQVGQISPAMRARMDKCGTEDQREKLIEEYARSDYFRQCAWTDYLNYGGDPPLASIEAPETGARE